MKTIQDLYQQAQLAEAAYAIYLDDAGYLITTDAQLKTALQNEGMSLTQATDFVNHYQLIDQYSDPGLLSSWDGGFSATVFKDTTTGTFTFAIRGTVGVISDLLSADLGDIVMDGLAMDQIVDMYNYWQSLNATGVYQAALLGTSLVETAELNALKLAADNPLTALVGMPLYLSYLDQLKTSGAIIDSTPLGILVRRISFGDSTTVLAGTQLATGSGLLASCPALDVVGHSLGGHLAAAFTRLFSNAGASATTINGAGFPTGTTPGLGGNALSNIQNLFSSSFGLNGADSFNPAAIYNVHGDGLNIVTMNSEYGLVQQGSSEEIYIESMNISTTLGHGTSQMTDSLAVYNFLATLDLALNSGTADNLATITSILKASSNVAANSLESAVTALGKLLGATNTTFTSNEFDSNREALYKALDDIKISMATLPSTGGFSLLDLSTLSASQIASTAQDSIAYRYSLVNLIPFALVGDDTLYDQHNTDGALDMYTPATGDGTLSNEWINDRADLLKIYLAYNNSDGDVTGADFSLLGSTYYEDKTTGFKVEPAIVSKRIIFGGELVFESLDGGATDDRVYGGSSNDTINGGAGSDYLEGGQGNDVLNGDDGNDTLIGGGGDDTLTGGKDNDIMLGGKGFDTYNWNTGDGSDTILDIDGQGVIKVNGIDLAGGNRVAPGKWQDTQGNFYTLQPFGSNQNLSELSGDTSLNA